MPGRLFMEATGFTSGHGDWYYPNSSYPHLHIGFKEYASNNINFIAFHAAGADRAVGLYNNDKWNHGAYSAINALLQSGDLSGTTLNTMYLVCIEYQIGTPGPSHLG